MHGDTDLYLRRACVRENRVIEIPNYIETGLSVGMQTMDQSIAEAAEKGFIDLDEAIARAHNPDRLKQMLNMSDTLEAV